LSAHSSLIVLEPHGDDEKGIDDTMALSRRKGGYGYKGSVLVFIKLGGVAKGRFGNGLIFYKIVYSRR
jgi:hypothetical protein